eukprot:RCo048762
MATIKSPLEDELELLTQEFEALKKDNKSVKASLLACEEENKFLHNENISLKKSTHEVQLQFAVALKAQKEADAELVRSKDSIVALQREVELLQDELTQSVRLAQTLEQLESEEAKELQKLRATVADYAEMKTRLEEVASENMQLKYARADLERSECRCNQLSAESEDLRLRLQKCEAELLLQRDKSKEGDPSALLSVGTKEGFAGGGISSCSSGSNQGCCMETGTEAGAVLEPSGVELVDRCTAAVQWRDMQVRYIEEVAQLRRQLEAVQAENTDLRARKEKVEAIKPLLKLQFEKHKAEIARLNDELNFSLQQNFELQQQLSSVLGWPQPGQRDAT